MSVDQTQQVIDHYFEVMAAGGDFSQCYAEEVSCSMLDADLEIRVPAAVRDYMIALHAQMSPMHTRSILVSDGAAYLEGDCPDPDRGEPHRIAYCAAYDITVDLRTYAPVPAATGTACSNGSTAINTMVDCQLTDGTMRCRNVR